MVVHRLSRAQSPVFITNFLYWSVDFFRRYYDSEDHIYVILFQHTV